MKQFVFSKKAVLVLAGSALVVSLALAQTTSGRGATQHTDTIPQKKTKQVRDLDEALENLEKAEKELQLALDIDGKRLQEEVAEAMKKVEIDMSKMKVDMAKALKEIDVQKINMDVQKSLAEAQKSMKEIDAEKIKLQVESALAKVDMDKLRVNMEKLEKIDMDNVKKELETIRPKIEKSMKEAKAGMEKARVEMTFYKNLVDALDRDGLLKKKENYNVEYQSGELTVNGKKLSAEETRKYNDLLLGHKNFTLRKTEDNTTINND